MQMKVFLKLVVLGAVSLVLLMALSSIDGLVRERQIRQQAVRRNIADCYAGEQQIVGPLFTVVYCERWTGKLYNKEKDLWYEKEMTTRRSALVFPEQLTYNGSLEVQQRRRGIFKANVFQSSGRFDGTVVFPERERWKNEAGSDIEIESITLNAVVGDARGISHVPVLLWQDEPLEISAGSAVENMPEGVHAKLPDPAGLPGTRVAFTLDLNLHGMGNFGMVPVGADNRVRLESPWPHPSFVGDFLATDRTVSDKGFSAEWNVNALACSARQDLQEGRIKQLQSLGVDLIDPVNVYPMTDRALKYGFLFIFITFAAFFLFEMVKQLKVHPVQYGFVGLAQAIFFLLLLSLSEHTGFGLSYFIASAATVLVITLYLCSVLKGLWRGMLFGSVLLLLYSALFGLLQSEDHALVAGSTLLFALLAFVMLLTRKVDWYALGAKTEGVMQ